MKFYTTITKHLFSFILISFISLPLNGCNIPAPYTGGEEEEDPGDLSNLEPLVLPTDTEGFWTEHIGIGADWYDYVFKGHNIVPRDYIYAITDTDSSNGSIKNAFFIQIVSYVKKDTTIKGYVTLKITKNTGSEKTISNNKSIKQNPICVSFDTLDFVPCDGSQTYDMLIAANKRPVVEFTLVPPNPTFSVVPKKGRHVYAIPARSIAQVKRRNNAWKSVGGVQQPVEMPNAYDEGHAASRLASASEGYVQITVQPYGSSAVDSLAWRAIAWRLDNDTLEYKCFVPGSSFSDNLDKKGDFDGSAKQRLSLAALQNGKIYSLVLCGGEGPDENTPAEANEITLTNNLWRLTNTLPVNEGGTNNVFFTPDTLYLSVDSSGKKHFFLPPNTLSWSYGKKYNIKSLDQLQNLTFKEGVIPFAIF